MSVPPRSDEDARTPITSSRHDRALGVACLVACPTISGLVLGLIAMVFSYPTGAGHAFAVGSLVGGTTFAANALAICLTACTVRAHAIREARSA